MSSTKPFSFILLLIFGVRGDESSMESSMDRVTRSVCGEDVHLRCLASSKPGVQYRRVTWYKVSEAPSDQLTGLVMKRLTHHNSTVQKYKGVIRDLRLLEDSQGLILPNVTLEDAGRYICLRSAPLGHQNQQGEVHLKVYDGLNEDEGTSAKQHAIVEIVAIVLLIVSLLMMYLCYTCLRKGSQKYKSRLSQEPSKKIHQIKDTIIKIESKGIVCTLLPQEYV